MLLFIAGKNMKSTKLTKQFIAIIIIFVLLPPIADSKGFKVDFQSSEKWSSDEWMEYKGHIPVNSKFTEFTVCHWEKLNYFSAS